MKASGITLIVTAFLFSVIVSLPSLISPYRAKAAEGPDYLIKASLDELDLLEHQRNAENGRIKLAMKRNKRERERAMYLEAKRIPEATILVTPEGISVIFPRKLIVREATLNFTPSAYKYLGHIVRLLRKFPEYNVQILVHTDSIGKETCNLNYSQKIADHLKTHLIKTYKIPEESIVAARGMGSSEPLAETPQSPKNRRIEFLILSYLNI